MGRSSLDNGWHEDGEGEYPRNLVASRHESAMTTRRV
jgi:hypothetical protein